MMNDFRQDCSRSVHHIVEPSTPWTSPGESEFCSNSPSAWSGPQCRFRLTPQTVLPAWVLCSRFLLHGPGSISGRTWGSQSVMRTEVHNGARFSESAPHMPISGETVESVSPHTQRWGSRFPHCLLWHISPTWQPPGTLDRKIELLPES